MSDTPTPQASASHSHSHSHPHSHPHSDPHHPVPPSVSSAPTHAEANRAHYDAHAADYDRIEMANELAARSAAAMLRVWAWDAERTVCMDYACGTGLVSRQLAPHAKTIVGVDISQGMVDYYNTRVANQGIPREEMRAVCAELKGDAGELEGMQFDVVVCSQAYHHFADIAGTTRTLASFLKPGGALLVVDLLRSAHALHMHTRADAPAHVRHTVAHKGGLEEADLRACFDAAGLAGFGFEDAYERTVDGRTLKLFIAKGVRP